MKKTLHAAVSVSLLLILGSAVSEIAAPPKGVQPAESLAPHKTAGGVEADSPEPERLMGSYTLVGEQADAAKSIEDAIDAVTAQMGGLKRSLARKRLEAVNKVVTRLEISSVNNSLTVGMNDFIVTVPLDGGTVDVKTPSGEMAKASFQSITATLVQDIAQTQGRRENAFRFNGEGNLVMQVRETSPQLASGLSYGLVFQRVGP